jgi:hypothetical protein
MLKDKALCSARAWAVTYVAFAWFLVFMLLVVDYIINYSTAYPGYDLDMFWFGPHLPFYLTWPEILFNWDAVVAEMPYDLMGALFMAGFVTTFIRSDGEAKAGGLIPHVTPSESDSVATRVSRIVRDPIFFPMVVAGVIVAVAFVGSAGAYGYQVPGLAGSPVFFTGLDDFAFTSHLLPIVLFFSGLFATTFLPLINAARARTRMKKEGLLLVFAAVLLLLAFYLASPVHYDLLLPPISIIYLIKGWLVSLVMTGYAIGLHVKRSRQVPGGLDSTRDTQDKAASKKKVPPSYLVVDVRVGLLTSIPAWILFAFLAWGVVVSDSIFSDHPALLFQHTFNMVLTCTLAIGLIHVADRFLIGSRVGQTVASLSSVKNVIAPGIQDG